jgi:beta-lactam-binding protein with PASTA domain
VVTRQSVVEVVVAVATLYDVPDVVGLQLQEAVRRLRGFTVGRDEVASMRPRGEVTDQQPRAPVRLPAGAEVRVEVSDGSLVRVPAVERQTLDEARAALGRADLQAAVAERDGDLAPGVVATQDPPAGREVKRGSAVRLVVSTGIEVPQVVGVQVEDARTQLSRFDVRETQVANRAAQGEVVTQRPDPGTRVAVRSRVEIEVSDGSRVVVPELKDKTLAEARAALEQVGLVANPEPKEDPLAPDRIVSQNPAAGEEASQGDAVQVVVSTGIEVPDVVNDSIETARGELAGFTVTEVMVSGEPPAGRVVMQEPAAGTRVAADSPVRLEVSDGLLVPPTPQDGDTGPVDDGEQDQKPEDGMPWFWILGGLAVAGAGAALARRLHKKPKTVNVTYQARCTPVPDSVHVTEVAAVGPSVRIAARLETGESVVRFDGDPT